MKNKDQQLLEEAYTKINEEHMPHSGVDPETEKMYWDAFRKFENDEITNQQWYDICALLLSKIMEKNKDVFVRLKHR